MADLARYVQWLWGLSVASQVAVCAVLFLKGNFRRIPLFTAYILSNVFQAVGLYVTYREFGARSHTSVWIAWASESATLLLRVLATSEVLRMILKPYRGIWGLGWRVLAVAFGAVFSFALIDSGRNLPWAIFLANRGFHLAFAVGLVACLLLVRYYLVPVHPVYKALLGGFCFYSCAAVLVNAISGTLFVHRAASFQMVWQLANVGAFAAVLLVWAVALRTPLPELAQQGAAQEAQRIYWEMSPRINERLRALNEQLDRFWKPEATRQ